MGIGPSRRMKIRLAKGEVLATAEVSLDNPPEAGTHRARSRRAGGCYEGDLYHGPTAGAATAAVAAQLDS